LAEIGQSLTAQSRFPPVPPPRSQYFAPFQAHCLALSGAWEDYPWGETVFKIGKKVFATCYQPPDGDLTVGLKATLEDQAALVQFPGITVAAYIGKHGWISATVHNEASFDLVRDLATTSYHLVKNPPKRARK
jgi:predicted DNA-binding protein (MmcQ/YjbR family)